MRIVDNNNNNNQLKLLVSPARGVKKSEISALVAIITNKPYVVTLADER